MERSLSISRSLLAALCAGYFLVLLDVTVVNVALPQIGDGLATGGGGLAWVVDAYTVPLAAMLLAAGAIGDKVGHRPIVLAGFSSFGVASVVCAVAPSIGVLIAARAVQGVGAALMLPGTLAILVQQASNPSGRTRLVGIWAAVGGCALPAGPLVGGLLVQAASWRAVFWLSVPVIAVALVVVWRSASISHDVAEGHARVDWAGATLLAVAIACAVAGIIQFPLDPRSSAILGAVAAVAILFLLVHERSTDHPLVVLVRVDRAGLITACVVAGIMNMCMLGGLFVLTQLLQDTRHLTPLEAGLATLPAMVPLPLLAPLSSRISTRIGVWRTSAVGLFIAAAGFTAIAISSGTHSLLGLLISLAVWGSGTAILTPGIVAAAMHAAPDTPGAASGASNTARQTGGAVGVALFAAIASDPGSSHFTMRVVVLFLAAAVIFFSSGLTCMAVNGHKGADR